MNINRVLFLSAGLTLIATGGTYFVFFPAPVSFTVSSDFTVSVNNGSVTIIRYTGSGGAVTIPRSCEGLPVTSIREGAFHSCEGLSDVIFPNTVTTVQRAAFDGCYGLTNVSVGACAARIGAGVFHWCGRLETISADFDNPVYSSLGGVLFDKKRNDIIVFPDNKAGEYALPYGVTSIADEAFEDCHRLTRVTIPSSVTNIGDEAFDGCFRITRVMTPTAAIQRIGNGAFARCGALCEFTIPGGVDYIGSGAFVSCSGLTTIVVPEGVRSIRSQTFMACYRLVNVTIPGSVTNIGELAFHYCLGLREITIPSSVASIGHAAFGSCSNLTSVFFRGDAPHDGLDVFRGSDNVTVYYQLGAEGWDTTFSGRPTKHWTNKQE